ncbi:MAG TPA: DegT/DnrJ/EryC1/StrS family aminotransferase, partial [Caulobacterales bacterium]|nr:DegT/DnrJ/EryC1/StrS family aminotransferase [Caulobacterales bacterium]
MAPLEAIAPYIERIDAARWYSNRGPLICELEARLSARCAGAAAVSVANATQGIALTLRALAPAGGLCLMPGFTFVATAHAALQAGLTPYFMDIDPASLTATPETIRAALARAPERPAAIVAVSPFGAPLDAAALAALSRDLAVPIVLDAAAAFDSVSSAPTPTIVSLHATKVLGAGEGGFVLGAPGLIDEVRAATNFGFMGVREAAMPATNAKMSEYAAAVALAGLDTWETTRARFLMAARKLRIAAFRAPHIEFQRGWGERWITSTCVVRTVSGD